MNKQILMAGCASLALLGALAVSPAYAVDPDAALAAHEDASLQPRPQRRKGGRGVERDADPRRTRAR